MFTLLSQSITTEWYRGRGYNFEITNSTSFDQSYREGGQVFENISQIVDDYFNVYVHRYGFKNPFFTAFCNGTTVTCAGLAQWGTVELANMGRTPLEILRAYYPSDIQLSESTNFSDVVESFPGYSLSVGSQGAAVQRMQNYLNRIRVNYPLIPQIKNPDGVFGEDTLAAVLAFQKTFNLPQDGVIGRGTWNQISYIFAAVAKLAELESEGERIDIGKEPPRTTIQQGDRGTAVLELQFILNAIAAYYDQIPTVIQDTVFGTGVKNAVVEFQKTFGLTPDGVVGPATWFKLYEVYHSIFDGIAPPPVEPPPPGPGEHPYPGSPLRVGSSGADVRLIQTYLNAIGKVYSNIPKLTVDGAFGPMTQEAVVAFQHQFLLAPDGVVGPLTWAAIIRQYLLLTGSGSENLEYPSKPLKVGSRGGDVRLMQGFLVELRGCYPSLPNLDVDGIFGPITERAVTAFQKMFGLEADGIIGPVTWYEIIEQRNTARC